MHGNTKVKLWKVASCWLYSANILAMQGPMNVKFIHYRVIVLISNTGISKEIVINFRNKVLMTWLRFVVCCAALSATFHTVSVSRPLHCSLSLLTYLWSCSQYNRFFIRNTRLPVLAMRLPEKNRDDLSRNSVANPPVYKLNGGSVFILY